MNIKIPVSWLREYLKTDLAAKTIAQELTLRGPSVERIEKYKNDQIFDIEVTTNRPDAFSVLGIAREGFAILSQESKIQLTLPKGLDLNLEPDVSKLLDLDVIIKNPNLCPRFTAIVLDNVKIGPSPAFIKNRLEACGIRAINNIVDISNYIMLELGQPMHAFDYDKIRGAKMILRASVEGEKVKTLDGKLRTLPKGAIVIENDDRLIDLCGIMGGENSQISGRTKRVVMFVQAYEPVAIRKTVQALGFRTEAATRFEKGVDLVGILPALKRSVYLAKKAAGAKIASELIDIYPAKQKTIEINLELSKVNKYLGLELPPQRAEKILTSLGFSIKTSGISIIASPPSWRVDDARDDVDLIEEIARIYGYHNLPSKLPQGQIPDTEESELIKVIELKKSLKYLGLTEVITYSIISEEMLKLTGVQKDQAVELSNPLTSEWQYMRPTLLPSLASVIAKNQNLAANLNIFEIAKTYEKIEGDLPKQDLKLAIVMQNSNFYEIKGLVENVFAALNRHAQFMKSTAKEQDFEKDGLAFIISSEIKDQKLIPPQILGWVGAISLQVHDHFELSQTVMAVRLNLSEIFKLPIMPKNYKVIAKHPPVIEDISAIFKLDVPSDKIIEKIGGAHKIIGKIEVVDVYEDEKIGKGKKSVTLRIYYVKPDSTPNQEEVAEARGKIFDTLAIAFQAIVRS